MSASYWHREAGWCDRWHEVALPARADFVVIGGGFSGLATAVRLRERAPGATIVVLEAERVGFGASGRNAGFLTPLAAPVWMLGAEREPDQGWGAARVNADIHDLARWIARHVPACELAPAELSLAATSWLTDCALREFAHAVQLTGLAHRLEARRSRPSRLHLAMDAYTMQPYKLAIGLAEHAARGGTVIRERARVRAVDGGRVLVDSGEEVTGRRVVLCTNAYSSSVTTAERVRPTVMHSFMAATQAVDAAALGRDGDFMVELNLAQPYHRMHAGRVIYGGIDKLSAPAGDDFAVPARVRARLARLMRASFPGADVAADDAWSGRFHATRNGLPIIRASEANPALVLNVGYGGTGVALALACAPLAAAVAAGDAMTPDDARLLATIRSTRITAGNATRALARILGRFAQPWRG